MVHPVDKIGRESMKQITILETKLGNKIRTSTDHRKLVL
jgi:hypothetical protein